MKYYIKAFGIVKTLEGITGSEEMGEWSVPYVDIAHRGNYLLAAFPFTFIQVPLFNLVYHDAVILPWGIRELGCLLNGEMPRISTRAINTDMERIRTVCALHKRVGLLEMTKHEFLDEKFSKQRTTFSDGTTVTIDPENNSFDIQPKLDIKNVIE